jgi:hypothetical protein
MKRLYFSGEFLCINICSFQKISIYCGLIFILFLPGHSQIVLSEIMFDADTLESHNEFVEIYNYGQNPVNLDQWGIGDDTELDLIIDAGYGTIIQPEQFGLILDASYFSNSTTYNHLIPSEALILTINDGSFGSYGWSNTNPEVIKLVNITGDTMQSYRYTLDNDPGYSDEKIILDENNLFNNWKNSFLFRGTPGTNNSVTPFRNDLALDSICITPVYPTIHQQPQVRAFFRNAGLDSIVDFSIEIFEDKNFNQTPDISEVILTDYVLLPLYQNDTISGNWFLPYFEEGIHRIGFVANYQIDENFKNNILIIEMTIESENSSIVINEIMYRPESGKTEWIELYNNSGQAINFENWHFADFRDTVKISDNGIFIQSNDFLVLAGDSLFLQHQNINPEKVIIIKSFPNLNNDYDDLFLYSSSYRVIDHVLYSSSWMRRDTDPGISLERINPEISSSLAENWGGSVEPGGSTPAEINSIYMEKPASDILIDIHPNPFSPDGDGYEDYSLIQFKLPFPTGFVTIEIFDITGRKIMKVADYEPTGNSRTFIWDGRDYNDRICRIGIYIVLVRIFNPGQDLYKELKKSIVLMKRG